MMIIINQDRHMNMMKIMMKTMTQKELMMIIINQDRHMAYTREDEHQGPSHWVYLLNIHHIHFVSYHIVYNTMLHHLSGTAFM